MASEGSTENEVTEYLGQERGFFTAKAATIAKPTATDKAGSLASRLKARWKEYTLECDTGFRPLSPVSLSKAAWSGIKDIAGTSKQAVLAMVDNVPLRSEATRMTQAQRKAALTHFSEMALKKAKSFGYGKLVDITAIPPQLILASMTHAPVPPVPVAIKTESPIEAQPLTRDHPVAGGEPPLLSTRLRQLLEERKLRITLPERIERTLEGGIGKIVR